MIFERFLESGNSIILVSTRNGWHFILYYIFCLCEAKSALQRAEKSQKNNISTGDWKCGIWNGEKENENKFVALALVVQGDFLLCQFRQRRNTPPSQKDILDLVFCNYWLPGKRYLAFSRQCARMHSLMKRMHNCQEERVLINIISQSELGITLRKSISESRINSILFQ